MVWCIISTYSINWKLKIGGQGYRQKRLENMENSYRNRKKILDFFYLIL
jgi:hypothetical protein